LGWLFRDISESIEKSDVLILVTPRIVTDLAVARQVMKDLEARSGVTSDDEEKAAEE